MKQILSIVILSFVLSCSQGNSDKELQELRAQNKALSEKVKKKDQSDVKAKQAARNRQRAADQDAIRSILHGMISAIDNSDFDYLSTLCCNECDTDTEVLNICNMGSMRLGDRIAVKQMYRNATLLKVDVDGTNGTGTIYFPRTKHKGTVELEKHDDRWQLVSM